MLLQPRQNKYKKLKKRYIKNQIIETKSFILRYGQIGLKALSSNKITARQIEAARQCINRELNRKGKIWINIFPSVPVTKKPTENRMGKGKGSVDHWIAPVKAGSILLEISGVPFAKAKLALLKGSFKLPLSTKIVFSYVKQ